MHDAASETLRAWLSPFVSFGVDVVFAALVLAAACLVGRVVRRRPRRPRPA